MEQPSCSTCKHSGGCIILGQSRCRFPIVYLERYVSEVFPEDKLSRQIITLIGQRFEVFNWDFIEALEKGYLTCQGNLTLLGYQEVATLEALMEMVKKDRVKKVKLSKVGKNNAVLSLDDARRSSSRK